MLSVSLFQFDGRWRGLAASHACSGSVFLLGAPVPNTITTCVICRDTCAACAPPGLYSSPVWLRLVMVMRLHLYEYMIIYCAVLQPSVTETHPVESLQAS